MAAGSNNTMQQSGGLFGVAVMAAVFAANGSYASPATFMHGIRAALLVAAAVALVAVIPALLGPSRTAAMADLAQAKPALNGPLEGRADVPTAVPTGTGI